jgi:hypothetical protein
MLEITGNGAKTTNQTDNFKRDLRYYQRNIDNWYQEYTQAKL